MLRTLTKILILAAAFVVLAAGSAAAQHHGGGGHGGHGHGGHGHSHVSFAFGFGGWGGWPGYGYWYPPTYYYPPSYGYYGYPYYGYPPTAYAAPQGYGGGTVAPNTQAPARECRNYNGDATIDANGTPFYGQACLEADGKWHIVN